MKVESMWQQLHGYILLTSLAFSQVQAQENGLTVDPGRPVEINELLETVLDVARPSFNEKSLRVSGDVKATDRGLSLASGSQLTIQCPHSSAWIVVETDLAFPEAAQAFRCEWTFDLDQALDASVVLERTQIDGKWIDVITFNDSRVFFSEAVRSYSGVHYISDGHWRFEYRMGLLVCKTPSGKTFFAKVDRTILLTGEASCTAASIRTMAGELNICRTQIQAGRSSEHSFELRLLRLETKRLAKLIALGDHDAVGNALPGLEQQVQLAIPNAPKSLESSGTAGGLLADLAWIHAEMGDYSRAEPLTRQSLEICRKVLGNEHPDTASCLDYLAKLYNLMGDSTKAEPLCRQSLEICQKVLGDNHPDTAASLNHLASMYCSRGENSTAEPLYRQGLGIYMQVFGNEHRDTAMNLNNLGAMYQSMGDYANAELHFRRSAETFRKVLGDEHPNTAMSLNNLGMMYWSMGDVAKAEPLSRRSLDIFQKVLGDEHPETASSLINLADFLWRHGSKSEPRPFAERSLVSALAKLEQTAAVQTEQQQFLMTDQDRRYLSVWLTVTSQDVTAAAAWGKALPWKGLITSRQAILRRSLKDDPTFAAFRTVTRQLSTLSLSPPLSPSDPKLLTAWRLKEPQLRQTWLAERDRLQTEHERLERELAIKSARFREVLQRQRVDADQIIAALKSAERPVALVDVLEYYYSGRQVEGAVREPSERRIAAFVVRPDREIVRVNLGPSVVVDQQVKAWRETFGAGEAGRAAGNSLRKLLWEPLQPHVDGMETVLVSPDGQSAQIPWGALPGNEPDSFLIEERSIAVVPIPQVIPELLSHERLAGPPSSLLLAGDIDYGGDPGTPQDLLAKREAIPRSRGGEANEWNRLPGAQLEMSSIKEYYEHSHEIAKTVSRVESLSQFQATEATFREQAEKSVWLHVITHGYFAPETIQSVPDADPEQDHSTGLSGEPQHRGPVILPGLLSGLVFAGANSQSGADKDDGILTTLEVTGLDLNRAEMVVLSACETGLGEVAGGEGLLGLQRAFQVAGAKTVVASLWKVPDAATARLMQRFYENLWDRKLGKLEALREAQLWMMKDQSVLAAGNPADKSARGAEVIKDIPSSARLPPLYWAAFVLSGDWR